MVWLFLLFHVKFGFCFNAFYTPPMLTKSNENPKKLAAMVKEIKVFVEGWVPRNSVLRVRGGIGGQ